jgi:peptidyl-prolyl cis-trans isomerase SurA
MIRIWIFGFSLLVIFLFTGCGTSNPILATIGDEKITLHDFEDNYAKNNGGWDTSAISSLDDRQKFLDLIIKFKLKVKEARTQGLEKDTAIINEMDAYKNSVAQSYLTEKEVIEPGIDQMYDRKKEEVRASYIIFRLPRDPKPIDTLEAFARALNAIAQIPSTPFDTLAYRLSEDPSGKRNCGDLGFSSGGKIMPELEDVCYSLKPGEYTKVPIRTVYGYNVIKVTGRRPSRGSVHLYHILMRFNETFTDTAAVRDTVWKIYEKLTKGASFQELVNRYSQDRVSVAKNGDIGFYELEQIPPVAADMLYEMPINSFSKPIGFNYGYHIFRVTEKKGVQPFKEVQKSLTTQYQNRSYKGDYKKYVEQLKAQYHVVVDSAVVKALISLIDSTKIATDGRWKDTLKAEMLKAQVFYCAERSFTVGNFADRVISTSEFAKYKLTPAEIWELVSKVTDNIALEEHARHATERYPVLAQLLGEYEEGILLYRIEQDEVWKKTMVCDSLLREYYNKTKENYRWPNRVNFAEIYVGKDSVAKAIYRQIRKKRKNFMNIAQEYTTRPGYKEKKGEWGLQPFTFNDLSRKASTMAIDSISEPFRHLPGWSIIKTLAIDSARLKTFEEAAPEVTNACQEVASKEREREWVDELMKKYPVEIHKEILPQAFKRKRVESQ